MNNGFLLLPNIDRRGIDAARPHHNSGIRGRLAPRVALPQVLHNAVQRRALHRLQVLLVLQLSQCAMYFKHFLSE